MGCAIGHDRHGSLPGLHADTDDDHARAAGPLGDQGGAHHRLFHASQVRAPEPVPDAISNVDLLYRADADFPGRRLPHPEHEAAGMKRLLLVVLLWTALTLPASAQCVMCYRTAHAQQDARAHVLNWGILILGAPPFLILAGFVAFVFRRDEPGE